MGLFQYSLACLMIFLNWFYMITCTMTGCGSNVVVDCATRHLHTTSPVEPGAWIDPKQFYDYVLEEKCMHLVSKLTSRCLYPMQ